MDGYNKYINFELIYQTDRSTIVKCIHIKTNKKYVLKSYNLNIANNDLIYIMNEAKISTFLCHENIIKTASYFYELSKIYFVQEYAEKGDLINIKSLYEHGRIPEYIVKKQYIKPLLSAVEYLHDNHIIHCDIKPENILIMADGTLKLCDFGLAIDTNIHTPNKFIGTAEFMAPEIVNLQRDVGYDEAIDMWAVGCVTYELIFGISPFYDNTVEQIYFNIVHSPVNFINAVDITDDCMEFILKLLAKDPIIRIDIKEALNSNFITKEQPLTIKRCSFENHNRNSVHNLTNMITNPIRIDKNTSNDMIIIPKRANSEPGKNILENVFTKSPQSPIRSPVRKKFSLFNRNKK